jgi:hypothetical protein
MFYLGGSAMTVKEILKKLESLGNEARHKHNAKSGAPDNQFGVTTPAPIV